MTDIHPPSGWRALLRHVAVQALFKSVLINMVAPAVLYRLSASHFPANSLVPLALSGMPPILWLAYGVIRLRAIDFLGLFAAENVVLAAIFLASLAFARPLFFHMARQLNTGNDPAKRQDFDTAADQPGAMHDYRMLTLGWTVALLIKAAGSYYLGAHFTAKDYLLLSPLWDLVSDSTLVTCSLLYGRAKLGPPKVEALAAKPSALVP